MIKCYIMLDIIVKTNLFLIIYIVGARAALLLKIETVCEQLPVSQKRDVRRSC